MDSKTSSVSDKTKEPADDRQPGITSIDALSRRLDALESESEIRRIMAEYLEAGDANDGARVGSLFITDGIWEATGRLAEVLGTHAGHAPIARWHC